MSALSRDAAFSPGVGWGDWVPGQGPPVPSRNPSAMASGAPTSPQRLPPQQQRGSVSLGGTDLCLRDKPPSLCCQTGATPACVVVRSAQTQPLRGGGPEQVRAKSPEVQPARPFPSHCWLKHG